MEALDEQERFRFGNIPREVVGWIVEKVLEVVEKADDALDVFPED